jgi:hypothetical protein
VTTARAEGGLAPLVLGERQSNPVRLRVGHG